MPTDPMNEKIPISEEDQDPVTDLQADDVVDTSSDIPQSEPTEESPRSDTDETIPDAATEQPSPEPPKHRRKSSVPVFSVVMFILAALCGIIYLFQRLIPSFADFFNDHISSVIRRVLAYLTCWFPFSLSEILLILLPVAAVLLIVFVIRRRCDTWRDAGVFCLTILSVVALLFNLFVLTFSAGYYGASLDKKLGIERQQIKKEELYHTAMILVQEVNEACGQLDYDGNGSSEMPYSYGQMNRNLLDAYDAVHAEYSFIDSYYSRVKPVMLSRAMSYTHITGVYTFFTGEANINVHFPDYTIPYTAAHELAHQRGIAREEEANFVAFLVCSKSDDAYIRYSGYLYLLEFVMNALRSADKELYLEVYVALLPQVHEEWKAYNEFYQQFENSVASQISGAVNDAYLQSQGTIGQRSYGLVVDLAVAYFR